ncbi:MAG: HAMP domain-containing protein, partial [Candidatus Hydrothermarchaeaceae archaeon]
MKIVYKFLLIFLAISLLPLMVLATISLDTAQKTMQDSIKSNLELSFNEKAHTIDMVMRERVSETEAIANIHEVLDAVTEANLAYSGKSEEEIQSHINQIDEEWIASKGKTETADRILNNELSEILKSIKERKPGKIGEIIVTDERGATVAMTATLSDYFQADEMWWEESFKGKTFLDDRGFDESVGGLVVGVVIPIYEHGGGSKRVIVGVIKVNYKLKEILPILALDETWDSYHISLVRSNGDGLVHMGEKEHNPDSSHEHDLVDLQNVTKIIMYDAEIEGYSPLDTDFYTRVPNPGERKGISGERWVPMRWHIFLELDKAEVFAPIAKLRKDVFVVGLLIASLVTILALFASKSILDPIARLKRATKIIGKGDLNHKINVETSDEIGDLAVAFDKMTKNLKETTTSRDLLDEEVTER